MPISSARKGAAVSTRPPRRVRGASSTRFSLRSREPTFFSFFFLFPFFLSFLVPPFFKVLLWFLPQYSEKEDKYEEEIKLLSDKLKEVSVTVPG